MLLVPRTQRTNPDDVITLINTFSLLVQTRPHMHADILTKAADTIPWKHQLAHDMNDVAVAPFPQWDPDLVTYLSATLALPVAALIATSAESRRQPRHSSLDPIKLSWICFPSAHHDKF